MRDHRSIPTAVWNDARRYYPGDDVVDWRVNGSSPAGRAFRAMARDPVFGGWRR